MEDIFSFFGKIPNWIIILVMVVLFVVHMLFFEKNIGYYAVQVQTSKNDSLEMQCNDLRHQIEIDSLIIESVKDSINFEHYLREEKMFIGEGETMYRID